MKVSAPERVGFYTTEYLTIIFVQGKFFFLYIGYGILLWEFTDLLFILFCSYIIRMAAFQDVKSWKNSDAFIVVYSCDDRDSFDRAITILFTLRKQLKIDNAVIFVGNKSDLVRSRVVPSAGELLCELTRMFELLIK